MILDDVVATVSSQLDAQAELGIQVTRLNEVPEVGPTNAGVWFQIPQVTAVFADLKGSTELIATASPRVAAIAYTYFIRAMAVTLESTTTSLALMITTVLCYSATSGSSVADYGKPCRVDMGHVGQTPLRSSFLRLTVDKILDRSRILLTFA